MILRLRPCFPPGFTEPTPLDVAGGLLPHLCTLTCAGIPAIGGMFLWHCPRGYPHWEFPQRCVLLKARTFLIPLSGGDSKDAIACPSSLFTSILLHFPDPENPGDRHKLHLIKDPVPLLRTGMLGAKCTICRFRSITTAATLSVSCQTGRLRIWMAADAVMIDPFRPCRGSHVRRASPLTRPDRKIK